MTDWQTKLKALVEYYQRNADPPEPCFLYDPRPPADAPCPDTVPSNADIRSFYRLCGGGEFGPMIRFIPAAELATNTSSWIETLRDYDGRGDILIEGRHLVFANDADGTPWIWDSRTAEVASFFWKGGDWEEPRFASFSEFMDQVFTPEDDDDDWREVLSIVLKAGA